MKTLADYIDTAAAARAIGVDVSQVCRYIRSGRLVGTRVGRSWLVRRDDVAAFVRPPMGNPQLNKAQ